MEMTEKEILELIQSNPEIQQYIEYQTQKTNGTHVKKSIADDETLEKYGYFYDTPWGGYYRLEDAEKIGAIIRKRIDPYGLSTTRETKMKKCPRGNEIIDSANKAVSMNEMSFAQYAIFKEAFRQIADTLSRIGNGWIDYIDKNGDKHTLDREDVAL